MKLKRSPLRNRLEVSKSVRDLPWAGKFIEGLFRDPKGRLEMDVLVFAANVITLRVKWNFSVSSWGRTTKHNKDVKGMDGSTHLLWLGVDIILEPMVKNKAFEDDAARLSLTAYFEKDHYHLQPK